MVTGKNFYWSYHSLLLIVISSVCFVPFATEVFAASPTRQKTVPSNDLTKTLATKLASAQSDTERDELLSQNSALLTPELNQLFVEQGRESFRQGNLPEAVGQFEIAKSIAAKIDDKLRLAQALTTLGNLYRLLGKDKTALARLRQASPLHDALGNIQGAFFTLLNIVMIEISENNYDETNLQRLLTMASESKKDDWIATSLSQLGMLQFLKGNYAQAMESHRKSLTLYERTGATEGVAFALHAIGILERVYGNYENALEYFEKSQALNEVLKRKDLYSRNLSSIGAVLELLGNHALALEYHQKSISAGEVSGSKFWTIFSLNGMGEIYRAQGNFAEALVRLEKALKLSEELEYRDRIAYVCLSIGEIKYLQRDYLKAVELAERALAIARQTGSRDIQWKALTAAGKAYYALNQRQKVEPLLEEATNTLELLRSTVIGEALRSSYFASVQQPYELYIDVLMQQHKLDQNNNAAALALQINERRLARSLLETLSEAHTDIRKGVDAQLLERERSLQRQLNAIAAQRMRMSMTDEKALTLNKEINALTADYQLIESEIRQSSPSYAALTQPRSLTVKQIQNDLLDADTVLLEYSLGKERSYVWLITSTSLNSFELPGRSQIETSARNVANLLNAGERWATDSQINSKFDEEAGKLSRTLLPAALVSQLRAKRLLIVSDGALQYLPFGVLPIAKTPTSLPLIAHYEIVTLPSASTLAVLRQENLNRPPVAKSVAVIADPVFEDTDERIKNKTAMVDAVKGETQGQTQETLKNTRLILQRALVLDAETKTNGMTRESLPIKRLPFTRIEAEGILAAAPPSLTLKATDFRANRETATSVELASYRYLHFATHGILNAEHPELSGIVLSLVDEQGKPVDGFLRLHDIYNLNLPADLVVLSACQTGLGKEIRGEGLVGLTRGFMYAGTPRVIASLWKVDDAATAELMKRFYSSMLKDNLRPAAALRRAKLEMWKQKRWQAPFYWGAFELQGEWR